MTAKKIETIADLAGKADFEIIDHPVKPFSIDLPNGKRIEIKRTFLSGEDYNYLLNEEALSREKLSKPNSNIYDEVKRHIIFLSAESENERIPIESLAKLSTGALNQLKDLIFKQLSDIATAEIKKNLSAAEKSEK